MDIKKTGVFIALFFIASCSYAETLEIVGTGDGMKMLRLLADGFEKLHPENRIILPDSIGSSGGIQAVGKRKYRLARIARPLKQRELHFGLSYEPWARSPVVFYSRPDVGVKKLTDQQILDLFSGKIDNWKQLDGADEKVRVITREETDSSVSLLRKKFPGFSDLEITPYHLVTPTTQKTILAVSNYNGSISYGPIQDALSSGLQCFSINNLDPTKKNWPFYNTLGFVYYADERNGIIAQFLSYMHSPEANLLIKRNYMVPVDL